MYDDSGRVFSRVDEHGRLHVTVYDIDGATTNVFSGADFSAIDLSNFDQVYDATDSAPGAEFGATSKRDEKRQRP